MGLSPGIVPNAHEGHLAQHVGQRNRRWRIRGIEISDQGARRAQYLRRRHPSYQRVQDGRRAVLGLWVHLGLARVAEPENAEHDEAGCARHNSRQCEGMTARTGPPVRGVSRFARVHVPMQTALSLRARLLRVLVGWHRAPGGRYVSAAVLDGGPRVPEPPRSTKVN